MIIKWTTGQTGRREEDAGMRYEAYTSLLDHRIRNAWLYHLYLDTENFRAVAVPLYISSASSNVFVQFTLGRQLQQAARDELVKYMSIIDGQELLDGADKAFEALSTLLGDDEFFFGDEKPGLFDASVFAYTYLIASDQLKWKNTTMKGYFTQYSNLVAHQDRLVADYFTG
jgi:metaxin